MKYLILIICLVCTIPACDSTNQVDQLIEKQLKSGKLNNDLILGLAFRQSEANVYHLLDSFAVSGIIIKNILLSRDTLYEYEMDLSDNNGKAGKQSMQMSFRFRDKPDSGLYYLRFSTRLFKDNDENKNKIFLIRDKIVKKMKKVFGKENWIEKENGEIRDEDKYEVIKSRQTYQVKGNRLISIEINEFSMSLSEEKERSNISLTLSFTDLDYTKKLIKKKSEVSR